MKIESRKQAFMAQIEHNILSGKWEAGDKLPSERELVDMYGASRTVVNAGLAELAQKGFLQINPRQWTKVADYKKEGTLAVIFSLMVHSEGDVDTELIQSVLDARLLVETECARLAAANRTD
ncbi:MAG: GntR family transcriptional regulator, partial [Eubacteriales bacterium]